MFLCSPCCRCYCLFEIWTSHACIYTRSSFIEACSCCFNVYWCASEFPFKCLHNPQSKQSHSCNTVAVVRISLQAKRAPTRCNTQHGGWQSNDACMLVDVFLMSSSAACLRAVSAELTLQVTHLMHACAHVSARIMRPYARA